MKKLLLTLLLFVGFICTNNANAQTPLYRMTDAEVSAMPVDEIVQKVLNGWDDMFLNIYYGMKYPDEAVVAFSFGFQKGMDKLSKSLSQGNVTNKQRLAFNVLLEFTDKYLYRYGDFSTAAAMFYKSIPKKDIDTVLRLKADAIQKSDTLEIP